MLIFRIKAATHGLFVYPLDDSYIHLSIARTLAQSHVWGINPSGFASASSSPGWTLLLAATDIVFGVHLITPVISNLVIVGCLLAASDAFLCSQARSVSTLFRVIAGLVLVVATPLPSLVLLGMEHVAQTLLILLMLWYGTRIACKEPDQDVRRGDLLVLLISTIGAAAIRYEAVFTVALLGLVLLARKRWGTTALLALSAALPPVAFGSYFLRHSGFWLPYSVISKSILSHPSRTDGINFITGRSGAPIVLLCFLVWLYRRYSEPHWSETQILLLLAAGVGTLHSLFAPIGWLMRYDSYFVYVEVLALLAVLGRIFSMPKPHSRVFSSLPLTQRLLGAVTTLVVMVSVVKFAHRSELGWALPVEAAEDRYDEHIQMARFVASAYDRDTIIVNDIGAVSFYTHAKLLDVLGLGSGESLRDLYKNKIFQSSVLGPWAIRENASIAIIMIDQENNRMGLPRNWPLAQVWRIPRNVIFRDHSIGFFATKASEIGRLCSSLDRFAIPRADSVSYNACPQLTNPESAERLSVSSDIVERQAQKPY